MLFSPKGKRPEGSRKLCCVSRLEQKQKNLLSLVDAIIDLDVTLDIIGNGPLRQELERIIGNNSRIRLLGNIPNEKLPDHLRKYEAFVLPSFFEGHPKTLIEAMSCGLPAITTDVPGINNLVQHGETAWLCEPNPNSIRDGILKVLSEPALADKLSVNGRKYVLENFNIEIVVKKEYELYQEVLKVS